MMAASSHQEIIPESVCPDFTPQAQIAETYNTPHRREGATALVEVPNEAGTGAWGSS